MVMNRKEKLKKVVELLTPVAEKVGAYNRDHLTHAINVINNASVKAKRSIEILEEIIVEEEGDKK